MRQLTGLSLFAFSLYALTASATDQHAGHHSNQPMQMDNTSQMDNMHYMGTMPIGVMGGHAHTTGEWMFSYRYMRMDMDGNRDGSDRVSTSKVLQDYMVAPQNMTMDMHMLGAMYGVNDKITVMLMAPYLDQEMDHVTRTGTKFTTRTNGIGDVKLGSVIGLQKWNGGVLNFNAGISLPTGSVDEKDDTPAGANQHLPYPMQLGSGTYDLMPGLTYLGHKDRLTWGVQGIGVVRLGDNDNDYSLGDRFNLTSWIVRKWTSQFSSSLRIDGEWWGNIDGSDRKLSPMAPNMVPTADPDRRGGRRFDLLVGASFKPASGWFAGQRIAAEFGAPVYQNLDGPQLETDWTVTVGWELML